MKSDSNYFTNDENADLLWGSYEVECAGCDMFTRLDDIGLCDECAAKMDRDLIRQREWDYSATAWACPEEKREELRSLVIKQFGKKLELIAPSEDPGKKKRRKKKRSKKGRARKRQ